METSQIIAKYKASTKKLDTLEEIIKETGDTAENVIYILLAAHVINGRVFSINQTYKKAFLVAKEKLMKENIDKSSKALQSMAELKAENQRLRERIRGLEEEQEEIEPRTYADGENQVEELKNRIGELQETLNGREAENSSLQERIKKLEEENDGLGTENVSLGETIEAMEAISNANHKELCSLRGEVNAFRKGITPTERNDLQKEIDRLTAELSHLDSIANEYNEVSQINAQLEKRVAMYKEDCTTAQRIAAEVEAQARQDALKLKKIEQAFLNMAVYGK